MISERIEYTVYGKKVAERPVLVECKPGATVNGTIKYPADADVFSCSVYKTQAPTGVDKYEATTADLYTGTICGFTGVDSLLDFTLDTTQVSYPTGAIDGEYLGVKFTATETGIFGGKSVADVIVKMNAEIEA